MSPQTIEVEGRRFVMLPAEQFEALQLEAEAARLPPLPAAGPDGTYPAIEYVRASLARDIILSRIEAGLTQQELAKRARVRLETLQRLESGKHSPSVKAVDKIDRALQQAAKSNGRKKKRSSKHAANGG